MLKINGQEHTFTCQDLHEAVCCNYGKRDFKNRSTDGDKAGGHMGLKLQEGVGGGEERENGEVELLRFFVLGRNIGYPLFLYSNHKVRLLTPYNLAALQNPKPPYRTASNAWMKLSSC